MCEVSNYDISEKERKEIFNADYEQYYPLVDGNIYSSDQFMYYSFVDNKLYSVFSFNAIDNDGLYFSDGVSSER